MDELARYGIQDTHASVLFCLRSDLSSRDGGPSLSNWASLTPDELLKTLEELWTHVVATLANGEDSKRHELANNAWSYLNQDRALVVPRWKTLLEARPPDEPSKTMTHRDRTPTPPSGINGEEGGTDDIGPPCDTPQPNTPTTRHVHTPIPARDEETGPVSVSRGQPRTYVDSPSPAPSMNRDQGKEISVEPPESNTEMLEPPSPEHLTEAPPTTTRRQPGPVCPHCEAQRDSIRDLVVHAGSCPRTPPSARAKTAPLIAGTCILCTHDVKLGKSLWKHEQTPHFIFPCLAIATKRGHPNCPTCKARLKEGCRNIDLNPIEYLMSERKDEVPLDGGLIRAEPIDASVFAILNKLAGILRSNERTLLLSYPKDILATQLHDVLARREATTESSQHADGGIGELLPHETEGHVRGCPIDTNTASRRTKPRHDATWRPNDEQLSVRQSIEVHTTATISDSRSSASSAGSASERPTTNHGLPATPPTPPIPVLGKRKRQDQESSDEGSSSRYGITCDKIRHQGLPESEVAASRTCSISSHARDSLPSHDSAPENPDQTARSSPPTTTGTTTQNAQCIQPRIAASPGASTIRASIHSALRPDGVVEEATLAPLDNAPSEFLHAGSLVAPSANDQPRPSSSTHDRILDHADAGSGAIPFFTQNDQNPCSMRDDDSSVPGPHHNPNDFDHALPSSISRQNADTARGQWRCQAGVGIHKRASTFYTSSPREPQTMPSPPGTVSPSPLLVACHRPAAASHQAGDDRHPAKQQHNPTTDYRFNPDSHASTFASQSTSHLARTATGPEHNQFSHAETGVTEPAQIPTEDTSSFWQHSSTLTGDPLSFESPASGLGIARGSQVGDITRDCNPAMAHLPLLVRPDSRAAPVRLWQDIILGQAPSTSIVTPQPLRPSSPTRGHCLYEDQEKANRSIKLDAVEIPTLEATLPNVIAGIKRSSFRAREMSSARNAKEVALTRAVVFHVPQKPGEDLVAKITLSPSHGQEIHDMLSLPTGAEELLGRRFWEAIQASQRRQKGTAIQMSFPDGGGDCLLEFAMEHTEGWKLMTTLYGFSGGI